MYARVVNVQLKQGKLDEAKRIVNESVVQFEFFFHLDEIWNHIEYDCQCSGQYGYGGY